MPAKTQGKPASTVKGSTARTPQITLARIGVVTGKNDQVSEWIDVHFNPASLQLQVSNELKDTKNNEAKQYIAKFSAKLTMELTFDTTGTGNDVTNTTRKLQAFVAPPRPKKGKAPREPAPPSVMFEWGHLKFKGIAENYRETLDFFSADGVPLRSTVNLTLSKQDQVFASDPGKDTPADQIPPDTALDTPSTSPAAASNSADAPEAARAVAQANGQDNLRFGNGSPLTMNPSVTLKPPAAFASAAPGGDLGLGLGGSGSGSASASAGLGVSAGGTAGVSALAKLSATEGAFAGLQGTAQTGGATVQLNTARLVSQAPTTSVSVDSTATFAVGGRATVQDGSGLRADVGARARLTFDGV